MPFTKYSDSDITKFEEKFEKKGDDECWIWNGYKDKDGYGRFSWNRTQLAAHRMALELHLGREIRAGLLVCHQPLICHCRDCVNPRHLREDTFSANALDRHIDGTMHSKVSAEQVREIRASDKSQRKLAAEYKISRRTIRHIKAGNHWKHILQTKE